MDKSAILPDGSSFTFWEVPVEYEREIHVNRNHPMADDTNEGTLEKPLATINAAAQLATAGTRVWIHAGEYREWVRPAAGGTDPAHMISYEAFGDGEVVIKASEQVFDFKSSTGWRMQADFNEEIDRENRQEMQGPSNYTDYGKEYAYGKRTKVKHHKSVDMYDRQQRISFSDAEQIERALGGKPFGVET